MPELKKRKLTFPFEKLTKYRGINDRVKENVELFIRWYETGDESALEELKANQDKHYELRRKAGKAFDEFRGQFPESEYDESELVSNILIESNTFVKQLIDINFLHPDQEQEEK